MSRPDDPLATLVSRTAKHLARAFEEVLTAAGGSTSTWLVLSALKADDHPTQGDLARAIGLREPTLTYHVEALRRRGFVTREREPGNRRVQRVVLTDAGEQLFLRLRRAAASFDGRLRAGLDDDDVSALRRLLAQLTENAQPD
jgi:MarR family transcriptional regulator for hemolysin